MTSRISTPSASYTNALVRVKVSAKTMFDTNDAASNTHALLMNEIISART